jgi:signal transduction histidine kinase
MRLNQFFLARPPFVGRAAAGFGLVTIITAATALGALSFARSASARREAILAAYAHDVARAFQAQLAAETMVASGRGYLLAPDGAALQGLHAAEVRLERSLSNLERPGTSADERPMLAAVRASADHYRALFDDIVEQPGLRPSERLESFRDQLLPARADLGARLEQLVEHKRELQEAGRRAARAMDRRTIVATGLLAVLGVALSVALAWVFTRHLAQIYRREQAAAARATAAAAAKEELLGIVAHDLRNPVSAILLKAVLLRRGSREPSVHKHAETIEHVAIRLEALIEKLLDAASIEAGRLEVAWKQCTVAEVLAPTIETFATPAAHKAVTLQQEVSRADLSFWGDPERIAQVLANLVGNAIKFTPEGGGVTIRAVESGFHTRIEVRDTGPGIASQHLPRVFERFWRADAGGRKGTGLGLYIAKGIVEQHRGRIWVESRVGVGSAFIFELPNAPPLATAREPSEPRHTRGRNVGEHPDS